MEHKAELVLAPEVFKTIKYLTETYPTEIGALGTGKIKTSDGLKYFYVEKLFFPEQKVSGASVHFTADQWGSIIKQMTPDEMGRICFYWHKHPGHPGHSHTDEDETFAEFMDKDSGRKMFAFLQTAWSNGKMIHESRIDLATPIRVTIMDKDINMIEAWDEEEAKLNAAIEEAKSALDKYLEKTSKTIKEQTDKITDKCVVKNTVRAAINYGYNRATSSFKKSSAKSGFYKGLEKHIADSLITLYEVHDEKEYVDNDTIGLIYTSEEEKVSIRCKDGSIIVGAGALFNKVMNNALNPTTGALRHTVRDVKKLTSINSKTMVYMKIQPKAKCYMLMKNELLKIFVKYNAVIVKRASESSDRLVDKRIAETKKELSDNGYIVTDAELIGNLIDELKMYGIVTNVKDGAIRIQHFHDRQTLGTIKLNDKKNVARFYGEELINIVRGLIKLYDTDEPIASLVEKPEVALIKTDKTKIKNAKKLK